MSSILTPRSFSDCLQRKEHIIAELLSYLSKDRRALMQSAYIISKSQPVSRVDELVKCVLLDVEHRLRTCLLMKVGRCGELGS